jgi:hypothetical protein
VSRSLEQIQTIITHRHLLSINKTDLAELVGADLSVMQRDSAKMRDFGPTLFAQVKHGVGVDRIVEEILKAYTASGAAAAYADRRARTGDIVSVSAAATKSKNKKSKKKKK